MQEGVTPQQGKPCPPPPQPLAAHTGGHGSNTQPKVLLCRQRKTPGG